MHFMFSDIFRLLCITSGAHVDCKFDESSMLDVGCSMWGAEKGKARAGEQ